MPGNDRCDQFAAMSPSAAVDIRVACRGNNRQLEVTPGDCLCCSLADHAVWFNQADNEPMSELIMR